MSRETQRKEFYEGRKAEMGAIVEGADCCGCTLARCLAEVGCLWLDVGHGVGGNSRREINVETASKKKFLYGLR